MTGASVHPIPIAGKTAIWAIPGHPKYPQLAGLDGAHYEIDLNSDRARKLRGQLERYVKAARKVTESASTPARVRRDSGEPRQEQGDTRMGRRAGLGCQRAWPHPRRHRSEVQAETGK
jgi:hypothetical protein